MINQFHQITLAVEENCAGIESNPNQMCLNNRIPTTDPSVVGKMKMSPYRRVRMCRNDNGSPVYKHIPVRNEEEGNNRIVQACIHSGRIWKFITAEECKPKVKSKTNFQTHATSWMCTYKKDRLKPPTDKIAAAGKTMDTLLNGYAS